MEKTTKQANAQGATAPKQDNVRELGKNLPAVIKPDLTLPQTIKNVEELYKKIKQRDRLEIYADQLASFEIKKTDEDLEPVNYYQGCKIEITDDSNGKFFLKHPAIIKEVVAFMQSRFDARRKEIEAQIKWPNKAA